MKTKEPMLKMDEERFIETPVEYQGIHPNYVAIAEKNRKGDVSDINLVELEEQPQSRSVS